MENTNKNTEISQSFKNAVSDSYIVFENDVEGLVQLSVPFTNIEKARSYVDCWKGKKLYIYKFLE